MNAQLVIHFDGVENWWAELSTVPGFTASAESLAELRAVVEECLPDLSEDVGEQVNVVSEMLADPDPELVGIEALVPDAEPRTEPVPTLLGTRVRVAVPA